MITDVMISEGGMGNHPSGAWALRTAATIFDTRETPAEKKLAAVKVQHAIAEALAQHFDRAMEKEADDLKTFADHCDSELQINAIAKNAVNAAQEAATATEWCDFVRNPAWEEAAIIAVGHMLASAMHIERLLFADKHPDNAAASAYKLKHQG